MQIIMLSSIATFLNSYKHNLDILAQMWQYTDLHCMALNLPGHLIKGNIMESTYVSGFCNWKDGTRCFSRHEHTAAHKVAVDVSINIPHTSRDVGHMLSSAHTQQKALNQHYLIKVAQNIRFLSRQGVALRGDTDESDGNFMQLMHLCAIDDTTINDMLKKTNTQVPKFKMNCLICLYIFYERLHHLFNTLNNLP